MNISPAQRIISESIIEKEQAERFIAALPDKCELTAKDLLKTEDSYIAGTVSRVEEEIEIIEKYVKQETKSLMMIGAGYFPTTLILMSKKLPQLSLFGVDSGQEVCDFTVSLLNKFGSTKHVQIIHAEADKVDYQEMDFVFLANALLHKDEILESIFSTAKKDVIVFTRVPIRSRKDIYEPLQLNQRFKIQEKLSGKNSDLWVLFKNDG